MTDGPNQANIYGANNTNKKRTKHEIIKWNANINNNDNNNHTNNKEQ